MRNFQKSGPMDIILVFITFIFIVCFALFLVSMIQYKKGQRILGAFSSYNLQSIEIRFSETSYSGLSQYGGAGAKATLHHGKGILIVTSTDKWFNRLYNNLPWIITSLERKELPIGFHFKAIEDFHMDKYISYTIGEASFIKRSIRRSLASETDPNGLKQLLNDFQLNAGDEIKTLL